MAKDLDQVDQNEMKLLNGIIWDDEKVAIHVEQRRIGPGGSPVMPTSVFATDKRLIIVNKANLGIRKDYEVIPYSQITSVRIESGMISSSVFVRVAGYDKDVGLLKNGREEGEIDGLRKDDAKRLADYISRRLQGRDDISSPRQNQAPAQQSNARFCIKCGASLQAGANFCPSCGAKVS